MSKLSKIVKRNKEYEEIFFILGQLRWSHRENIPIKNFIDRLYLIFSKYKTVPQNLSIELTPKDTSVPLYPIILFDLGYKITELSDEKTLSFIRIK